MAFIIGVLAAHQFKFNGAGAAIVGTSAMIGSGAVVYSNNSFMLKGIGDIINKFGCYYCMSYIYGITKQTWIF